MSLQREISLRCLDSAALAPLDTLGMTWLAECARFTRTRYEESTQLLPNEVIVW